MKGYVLIWMQWYPHEIILLKLTKNTSILTGPMKNYFFNLCSTVKNVGGQHSLYMIPRRTYITFRTILPTVLKFQVSDHPKWNIFWEIESHQKVINKDHTFPERSCKMSGYKRIWNQQFSRKGKHDADHSDRVLPQFQLWASDTSWNQQFSDIFQKTEMSWR